MNAHTPGPWTYAGTGRQIGGPDSVRVADTWTSDRPADVQIANARLIAAAPELLEALRELLADKYLSDPINTDRMANARAAIAKAKGRS